MKAFLDLLARHKAPSLPVEDWESTVGRVLTQALIAAELIREVGLSDGDSYPCPSPTWPGCPRRIIQTRQGELVAVCGDEGHCEEIPLSQETAYQVEVDSLSFSLGLAALMGLEFDGSGVPGRGVWSLGSRKVGTQLLRVFYASGGTEAQLLHALNSAPQLEAREVRALAVPQVEALSPSVRRALDGAGVKVIYLEQQLSAAEGRVCFNWASFLLRERWLAGVTGADLFPDVWLLLDPDGSRYWLAGEQLAISPDTQSETLLLLLSDRLDEGVGKVDIAERLWPKEFTSGPAFRDDDAQAIDGRTRKAINELKKKLKEALRSSPAWLSSRLREPISTHKGVVRLDVPLDRLHWLSRSTG